MILEWGDIKCVHCTKIQTNLIPIRREILQRLQKLIAEDNKAKAEKDALRAFKCSLLSFRIYQTNLIERGFVEDELYTTRKELQDAEDRGEGKLNWATFDDLVKRTKILFKL